MGGLIRIAFTLLTFVATHLFSFWLIFVLLFGRIGETNAIFGLG